MVDVSGHSEHQEGSVSEFDYEQRLTFEIFRCDNARRRAPLTLKHALTLER
jgi:hypothetical protein